MPVDCGSITASSPEAATAASAAVPPARSTSIAVSAASGWDVATMAFWAWTVDRPAKWKLLMRMAYLESPLSWGFFRLAAAGGGLPRASWHIQYHLRNAWSCVFLNGSLFAPFPRMAPLINPPHAIQGRRLLPVCFPARLSRFARTAARPLRRSQAQGEHLARS